MQKVSRNFRISHLLLKVIIFIPCTLKLYKNENNNAGFPLQNSYLVGSLLKLRKSKLLGFWLIILVKRTKVEEFFIYIAI